MRAGSGRRGVRLWLWIAAAAMLAAAVTPSAAAGEVTGASDNLRTGWYSNQPGLSPSAVSSASFHPLFTAVVDGQGTAGAVIEAAGDRLVVAAGESAVRILILQLPGKKPFAAAEFLRGHRVQSGDRMGV